MAEKDKLIDKLYGDVKELHIKLERVTTERNEVLEKHQDSEKIWRGKQAKQIAENKSLYEMNESLKEDNHAIII